MSHARKTDGFTLIELLLAMAFISVLLMFIALTVIQLGTIYNRGLTLKSVDQAGRSLTADIRNTISESQPFDISGAFIEMHPQGDNTKIVGGRLCTGTYSYAWNLGKALAAAAPVNVYDDTGSAASSSTDDSDIHLVRIRDNGAQYCANQDLKIKRSDATELLKATDTDLALQGFSITRAAYNAAISQALYTIAISIGTNNQNALYNDLEINAVNCRPPSDADSLQAFCAVNEFNFTALAGSKGGQ